MTDKNKFADEIMSDDELDNVAGGTTSETYALKGAIGRIYYSEDWNITTYLPDDKIASYLKEHYNIDATINVGKRCQDIHDFVSEGEANQYSRNGQTLTHNQVLDIITISKWSTRVL